MNLRLLLLAFVFVLQSIAGSAAPAARDEAHDFDFQFGTWTVHAKRLLHPLSGSTSWVRYQGTHVVTKVWGGRANLGVLQIDGPSGHIEGQSLRLYNPQTHQWSFTFARSDEGTMDPPMIGEFNAGRGVFFNQESYNGRAVLVRNITSNITPTAYRDEYAYSADGGRTWETNWIATFALANSQTQTVPALDGSDPQQHAFDFEWGSWRAHLRRLLHPLTGSHTWVAYDGPSVVRKIWNGRANLGEIDLSGPAGRIVGLSLRLYNPQAREWNISFSALGDGILGTPPNVGAFANGRGEFYDRETMANGRAIYCRFVFSDISQNHFHFEQSFSDDGAQTWEVNGHRRLYESLGAARERDTRAVMAALATFGDGWKLLIVSRLLDDRLTLCALGETMPDALSVDLKHQLRELIADDIVCVDGKGSPWETYSVTDYGRTLIPALDCMGLWGRTHLMRFE